jgi:SAM-dependent methyltransferase
MLSGLRGLTLAANRLSAKLLRRLRTQASSAIKPGQNAEFMWKQICRSTLKYVVRAVRRLASPLLRRCVRPIYFAAVEPPKHLDAQTAQKFLDQFRWDEEIAQYHRNHLVRYLKTLDFLFNMAKDSRVCEVGAPPYGMTLLMRHYMFDYVTTASCLAADDSAETNRVGVHHCAERTTRLRSLHDGVMYECPEKDFNIETDAWPYENGSFDLITACEVFEHLALDPMNAISEANRVLCSGGRLLITVPNALALRNVVAMLEGRQPNSFPYYRPSGVNRRHNRELTSSELAALLEAGGFAVERLETMNAYPQSLIDPFKLLGIRALGGPLSQRGDMLVGMGRKVGAIRVRYPTSSQLYYKWDVPGLVALNRQTQR